MLGEAVRGVLSCRTQYRSCYYALMIAFFIPWFYKSWAPKAVEENQFSVCSFKCGRFERGCPCVLVGGGLRFRWGGASGWRPGDALLAEAFQQ